MIFSIKLLFNYRERGTGHHQSTSPQTGSDCASALPPYYNRSPGSLPAQCDTVNGSATSAPSSGQPAVEAGAAEKAANPHCDWGTEERHREWTLLSTWAALGPVLDASCVWGFIAITQGLSAGPAQHTFHKHLLWLVIYYYDHYLWLLSCPMNPKSYKV